MKQLLKLYSGLPREIKMLVAMAGLGTPIGVIYLLARVLGLSTLMVILLLGGLVAVIALISFVVPRLFGRSSRRRAKRMETDLASGADAGPVSMDLRAAVKSNNEKFFTAIKDMRKLGVSVYDLPWYIVIGDSGCGKTKLINEGGLTFSTGKPEGYQLGTLNYNWWFTEDAIFIDMAGRLCNPQEDADRREWESFLKTVAGGRRGYPINGVLVCVSAEHLLQESPEQHEADANTMLERLRDLQTKLGVTFATYLVVTKCDKIVGFMQYFDRAERDITIKNQIFGWSRPGNFHELYDPEGFGREFDSLYGRLHELRLRRIQDDVDEFELGMAYSFPEEFRQIKEPLQTYVRTLFPAIKQARVVKNLIFRGVYFTSATQQGGLILRHLTERLGADAARQFQPLESMYPRPRPHFVKDLLFRKVFPEEGLVFRNEQEVIRNRKLARLLTGGTVALGVCLAILLVVSSIMFGKLVSDPRQRARAAPELVGKPAEALEQVGRLGSDATLLRASIWPRLLSLGIGADQPVRDLTTISVRLFAHSGLRMRLHAVDQALRNADIVRDAAPAGPGVPLAAYLDSLIEYVAWTGCAGQAGPPERLDYQSFARLSKAVDAVPASDDRDAGQRTRIDEQAVTYFSTIHSQGTGWENPAAVLRLSEFHPTETVRVAVGKLHDFLARHYATLSDQHPDPTIREWMRIRDRCATIQAAYDALLAAADRPIGTQEDLDAFAQLFDENFKRLSQAREQCQWQGAATGSFIRIPPLRDALWRQRAELVGWQRKLSEMYAVCAAPPAGDPTGATLDALIRGDGQALVGLDRVFAESIHAAGLADRGYFPEFFDKDPFEGVVREVHQAFGHILTFTPRASDVAHDTLEQTGDLRTVYPVLEKINGHLAMLSAARGGADTPDAWVGTLRRLLSATGGSAVEADFSRLNARWQTEKLKRLNGTYEELVRKGEGTALLRAIEERLATAGAWGLAELAADWRQTQASAYHIPVPMVVVTPTTPEEPAGPPPVRTTPTGPPPVRLPGSEAPPPTPTPATPAPPPVSATGGAGQAAPGASGTGGRELGGGQIPLCTSPEFLNKRAGECFQLLRFLADFEPRFYFAKAGETAPRNRQAIALVESAWQRYCESYVRAWNEAYGRSDLAELPKVDRFAEGWTTFAAQFQLADGRGGGAVGVTRREFEPALSEVLRATRWATYLPEGGWWLEQQDAYYAEQTRRVADLLAGAFREHWAHGPFVREARASAGGGGAIARPWDALAAEVATRWGHWAAAVGANAVLPERFDIVSELPAASAIPWRGLPELRAEAGLREERLTQQLVDFQAKAQAALSAELTRILYGIQERHFAQQMPFDGWPYLNPEGKELTALQTVEFELFLKFLGEMRLAAEALRALDRDLPDGEWRRARQAFIAACDQWRAFLGLTAQGAATALDVTVWTEDPVGEPYGKERVDDAAQHYYRNVRLAIALRLQEAGDRAAVRPLEFRTVERGQARAVRTVWEWTRANISELTFELVDGIQPEGRDFRFPAIRPRVLGEPGPLAFCAYLHRYGRYVDRNWIVTHGVDLAAKFREAGQPELAGQVPTSRPMVGEKFVFQLPTGRNLPDPIPRLGPPPAAGTR